MVRACTRSFLAVKAVGLGAVKRDYESKKCLFILLQLIRDMKSQCNF